MVLSARLALKGLPLGANKCNYLRKRLPLLGVELFGNRVQIGSKALGKLMGSRLPETLKELQALLGRMNFAQTFILDYKRIIRPLVALLSSKSNGEWSVECTQAVNQVLHLAA